MKRTAIATAFLAFVSAAMADSTPNPYAGQENRHLKALSDTEVQDYLAGKGMGFSKVAELNSRPGPSHVLQLANEMRLTPSQLDQIQQIHHQMQADAASLGKELVLKEEALQASALRSNPSPDEAARLINESAAVQGRLRAAHVLAHLKTTALLSPEQIAAYNNLRGYTSQTTAEPSRTDPHLHHH